MTGCYILAHLSTLHLQSGSRGIAVPSGQIRISMVHTFGNEVTHLNLDTLSPSLGFVIFTSVVFGGHEHRVGFGMTGTL
jgi:hypothetical protein